jgi:Domain of unknown function (DUF1844)
MADKEKDSGFKVSDRRLFNADGDLRSEVEVEVQEAEAKSPPRTEAAAPPPPPDGSAGDPATDIPAPPTAQEQQQQHEAYQQSARELDARVELGGHSAKELEMTFERFMASLYMSAMMQLGLMHEQGGSPRVDLIGARQTIDTLGMLVDKTKGNLTPKEQNFLQNCLYELRMAYVEVTNALARPPKTPGAAGMTG